MTAPVLSFLTVVNEQIGIDATAAAISAQNDPRWEWLVIGRGAQSPLQGVASVQDDHRVRRLTGGSMSGSEMLATVVDLANGRYLTCCSPGDQVSTELVSVVDATLDADGWLYTDETRPDEDWAGLTEWRKPGFGPELLRSTPYLGRSAVLPRDLVERLGGIDVGADTAAWYDLILRAAEVAPEPLHLTSTKYQRMPDDSAGIPPWPDGSPKDNRRVLIQHCDRSGIDVLAVDTMVVHDRYIGHRVHRRDPRATTSAIIPTRGSSSTIHGFRRVHVVELVREMLASASGPDQIVVVHDVDTPSTVIDDLLATADDRLLLVPFREPFNFARKCNVGALHATGSVLCLLNDDVKPITPDWLGELTSLLTEPSVGAVGAKLLFADRTLQHAGHDHAAGPGHFLFGYEPDTLARGGLAQLTGERSGVTAACMVVRRSDFVAVGGFSETFPNNYNDVDLCLKLRHVGLRVLYSPHAVMYHFESQTRQPLVSSTEKLLIERRWGEHFERDPYLPAGPGSARSNALPGLQPQDDDITAR